MPDFGTDFNFAKGRRVQGFDCLRDDLFWRFQTPLGGLFYAPEYGVDIREYVQGAWDADLKFELETVAKDQAERDPRVLQAAAEASQVSLERLRLRLDLQTADGPFALVLEASNLEVSVLYADPS
ncbi:MAG: hypothetical protein SF070_18125 [Gemmatimonadota bacterium]|nr:hypothetical protein [Gemmatimonadota bacterium]